MNFLKLLYKKILVFIKRLRLKNHNFSLISNNCCGGIIYNSLGERFNSPTVNLFIRTEDYLAFLENFEETLKADMSDVSDIYKEKYPVGRISLASEENIDVHFMHYKSFDQAKQKWNERRERVNFNNLFIFMEAGIETTEEIVARFDSLPFENKVIITNKPFAKYNSAYFIDIYDEYYTWGKLISYIPKTLRTKRYIDKFNYIKWLNGGKRN